MSKNIDFNIVCYSSYFHFSFLSTLDLFFNLG